MAKYRKILVAYDGSPSARNALAQASRLARQDNSWIKVLAVLPSYEGDLELIGVSNIKETIEGPGRKLLEDARQVADAEGVHVLANLEQGEPYDRIVHVAEDENCDLIIMGRRGRTHVERELVGGVTSRVIGHTRKDVLVVPKTAKIAWDSILLATDGSPYSEAAVAKAFEIAKDRGSRLTALSVAVSGAYSYNEFSALAPQAALELANKAMGIVRDVKKHAEQLGIPCEALVREDEPYEAIHTLAGEINASLIVMGSHGRKGLTRLFMGSVTEHVVGLSQCPVLISHLIGS